MVKSDGTIWFTDPSYGILSDLEGWQGELRIRRLPRLLLRSRDRRAARRRRRFRQAQRHRLLARREDPLHRRHRRLPRPRRPAPHPRLRRQRQGQAEEEPRLRHLRRRPVRRLPPRHRRPRLVLRRRRRPLLRPRRRPARQDPGARGGQQRLLRRAEEEPALHLRHDQPVRGADARERGAEAVSDDPAGQPAAASAVGALAGGPGGTADSRSMAGGTVLTRSSRADHPGNLRDRLGGMRDRHRLAIKVRLEHHRPDRSARTWCRGGPVRGAATGERVVTVGLSLQGRLKLLPCRGYCDGPRSTALDRRPGRGSSDTVHVDARRGNLLGKILVPEVVSNVCFGGVKEEPALYLRHDQPVCGADACERGAEAVEFHHPPSGGLRATSCRAGTGVTQGCARSHHSSIVGASQEVSSSVPALMNSSWGNAAT